MQLLTKTGPSEAKKNRCGSLQLHLERACSSRRGSAATTVDTEQAVQGCGSSVQQEAQELGLDQVDAVRREEAAAWMAAGMLAW